MENSITQEHDNQQKRINKVLEAIEGLNIRQAEVFLDSIAGLMKEIIMDTKCKTKIETSNPTFQNIIKEQKGILLGL